MIYHINSLVTSHRGVLRGQEDMENESDEVVGEGTRNTQYRMPIRYVPCLDSVLNGNPNITDPSIKNAVMVAMGLESRDVPDDFPTEEQLITKATTLKKNIFKQRGIIASYVMPEQFESVVQAQLRAASKMKAG